MNAISPALAVLAALLFGLSVVLIRKVLHEINFITVTLVITIIGSTIIIPVALLTSPLGSVNAQGIGFFLVAGFLHPGLARLLYFKGMEKVGASINASIFASYPMFSAIIASILLQEELTYVKLIGVLCVVLGSVMVQRAMHTNGPRVRGGARGLVYPFLAALTVGLAYVIKKLGLNVYDAPMVGTAMAYVSSLIFYALVIPSAPNLRKLAALNKRSFGLLLMPGILICAGHMSSFYAVRYGDVSLVTPLIQTEPLFIFLLVRYYLKGLEPISPKLVIGAIAIILGVALVVAG